MASFGGRSARILVGLVLTLVGLVAVLDTAGYVIAAVGLVPLLAGVLDFCVLAPLMGLPFPGPRIRAEVGRRRRA